jgi:hypothetical protein
MSTLSNALVGLTGRSLDVPNNTNLGQDLSAAGSDFGTMIEGVGNAVAATQLKLATTSANTASVLANTKVDVIAVQQTVYDDSGNIQSSQSFVRNLPLIDFVDPVFYQWSQVRLQGKFFLTELASKSQSSSDVSVNRSSSGQEGLLLFFGGGYNVDEFTETTTNVTTTFDQASAVGIARMYAQLNPRSDVGVPKPTQVIQGPSLNIVEGEIKDVAGPPQGRTMSLLLQLRRADGTPIQGKAISVDTDGVAWNFTGAVTTDANGNVQIQLERTFLPVPPDAPPGTTADTSAKQFVVTARLGMVANNTTVTF